MNAFKSNIFEYMNGTRQYSIPIYQRLYSWEVEHCRRLWTDIVSMQKNNREGHFVGSIVRIDEVSAAGFPKAMIIDGQQRLKSAPLKSRTRFLSTRISATVTDINFCSQKQTRRLCIS